MVLGTMHGYLPNLINIILVILENNVPRERTFFYGMGLKVGTRSRYLRNFIGDYNV